MAIRRVASKLKKTLALQRSAELNEFIPETHPFKENHLESMLEAHAMVYVKPNRGTHGHGVMKVVREEGEYLLMAGTQLFRYPTFEDLHRALASRIGSKPYLIQKGIHLLTYEGKKFDIRVLTQMSPKGRWVTTAVFGKVAGSSIVVTNFNSGGKLADINTLLKGNMTEEERVRLIALLKQLGVTTAAELEKNFPGLKEIGLDVGLDEDRHPWIFEVNTKPDITAFRNMKFSQCDYRLIRKYGIAYGRLRGRLRHRRRSS
ncbi:hypothetical protein J27TS7_58630 [Paenibacillus dendritiformis]|uniref:YheC/YheD family protein n=1 Tax=Paenibacillus dendritiformis TaxID=130049 RepID=UPI001B237C86|nr:YheC/YheD family protein [Paenibacillus dendritiformis]GIO76349.1 hypothetical protein J27TS7_58630 [Paenibacillus dendritiformis]